MAQFSEQCQAVVAIPPDLSLGTPVIDGKVLRRSFDHDGGKSALHMVSAWGSEQR